MDLMQGILGLSEKEKMMVDFTIICMMFFCVIAFMLMAFGVFAIGFLVGYKAEDKRLKVRKNHMENIDEKTKEEKMKKDWKKFLEYDGSAPNEMV